MNWAEHNLFKNGDVVSIAAWLKQGFSLRIAGNVSARLGDIAEAQRKVKADLGAESAEWIGMKQVHSNRIQVVESRADFAETDGMITNKKEILLVVLVADCVPILLVDPVRRVIGGAHAGRRGTEQSISKAIVNQMVNYGSKIEDLQAAIGPSIGPCCYEINREKHEYFDLWETNEQQMREIGVKTIIRTDLCTKDHNEVFFSYRGDEVEGRFAGLIGMA